MKRVTMSAVSRTPFEMTGGLMTGTRAWRQPILEAADSNNFSFSVVVFDAEGLINDACDVKLGMTNASVFAYVADGHNGLRVIQLTSPRDTPGYTGFSPTPTPRLIATFPTHGRALAISKGLDRDRAVDESGNQIAVFGRLGARPLNLEEQRRLYTHEDGKSYTVRDDVSDRSRKGIE